MKKYFPPVILVLCVLMLFKSNLYTFNKLPLHKHAWSQLDHYSLSLGFVENDLNFFKPQTLTYNYYYPGDWKRKQLSRITNVDFPVHHYIPAVIMKATGSQSPLISQLYTYFYSLFGLFFLYQLSLLFIKNRFLALFPVLIMAFSPVFIYYQNGFLPSIPSLANMIMGIYFYCRFVKEEKNKYWIWTLVFLTLALLARTSYLFMYLSVFAVEFVRLYRMQKISKAFVIGSAISFASIGIYYLYNVYLRNTYGSLFLSHPMPAKNFSEFLDFAKMAYDNWKFTYFSKKQYYMIAILMVLTLVLRKRVKDGFDSRPVVALAVLICLSSVVFFVLMEQQFINHDYYFIDCFLFPVLFAFILILAQLKAFRFDNWIYAGLAFIGIFYFRLDAKAEQEKARITGPWDVTNITNTNFANSKKLLAENGIPESAVILCYNANPPTLPFYLMGRKGIAVIENERELLEATVNWKYDYMVFQNEYFIPTVFEAYPEIIQHFEVMDTDGRITLCKKLSHTRVCTLEQFLQLDTYPKMLESKWNEDPDWGMSKRSEMYGVIGENEEFGATYKNKRFSIAKNESLVLKFNGKLKQETLLGGNLVFSISRNGENVYYKSFETADLLKNSKNETEIQLILPLPQMEMKDAELGIHIWNPNHNQFWYKDFGFVIYRVL